MLVLRPDGVFDTKDKQEDLLKKLFGETTIHIKELTYWGKKLLAYPILKHKEAFYLLVKLEAPPLLVGEVEKQARLGGDVIRYLLTKND